MALNRCLVFNDSFLFGHRQGMAKTTPRFDDKFKKVTSRVRVRVQSEYRNQNLNQIDILDSIPKR